MTGCMNKGGVSQGLLELKIVENGDMPLYEEIASILKELIVSDALPPGSRIPSLRQLSQQTEIAIATIRRGIDLLVEEGWLVTRRGSGTFVSESAAAKAKWVARDSMGVDGGAELELDSDDSPAEDFSVETNAWSRRVNLAFCENNISVQPEEPAIIDFRPGAAVTELYSDPVWEEIMLRVATNSELTIGDVQDPQGILELRDRIAKWLNAQRGMNVTADSVFIVNGSQQARDIVARLLVNNGTCVGLEDPGSIFVRTLFQSHGAQILPIAVDDSGLIKEELIRATNLNVLYTAPSAQFPTSAVLAYSRRKWLAEWADEANAIIIEDDNYSDLVYDSRPVPSICSLNPGRTIYFGSFSQLLLPSWRLGYMVVPPQFRQAVARLKWQIDRGTAPLVQQVALELFRTGYFYKQLAKVHRMCAIKRNALLGHIDLLSAVGCKYTPTKGGLHQTVWLPSTTDDMQLFSQCLTAGLGVLPVSPHYLTSPSSPGILINFSAATELQIEQGVWRIRKVLGGQHGA